MPTAVASSHHNERSVSIMRRCGLSLAALSDAEVVDGNPAKTAPTISAATSAPEEKRLLKFNARRSVARFLRGLFLDVDRPWRQDCMALHCCGDVGGWRGK